ncbi:MAG: 5-(carboxyamino)imidazole ribonucleotide synthase [Chloroflexi bacterium]|nr:5-(carboxyamino)imidazole ribonucleotide synthase [Chloroflexota bacterium]|tara:strand:- start:1651 stop:2772 length:1122 start_codon:yes stop_codon:yes gene_type:complete
MKNIGIIGGGQLGKMIAISAKEMGINTTILDPNPDSPAFAVSDQKIIANYDDIKACDQLVNTCDIITYEFENVNLDSIKYIEKFKKVLPSSNVLSISQNRIYEKQFFKNNKLPIAKFKVVKSEKDIEEFSELYNFPVVIKTATEGYDGKGQKIIKNFDQISSSYVQILEKNKEIIVEEFINFSKEVSIICSRDLSGRIISFPISENIHLNHILDKSIVPARISKNLEKKINNLAQIIVKKIELIGLICIEMFIVGEDIFINEIAPRPHNSGHYTLDACDISQFDQVVKILLGFDSTKPQLLSPVVMFNILGDIWIKNKNPNWKKALNISGSKLYLYGKKQPRIGRKMGHINILNKSLSEAIKLSSLCKSNLIK